MMERRKCALLALHWTLGVVVLIEAVFFVMPNARHDFAATRMPDLVRQLLGWGEIVGAVLFLIPRTTVRGGWILASIFILAIVIHLLHGIYDVGNLAIYTVAVWVVVTGK